MVYAFRIRETMQLLINKINSLNWFKDHFLRKPHGQLDEVVEKLHTQKSIYTSTCFGTISCQEIEKLGTLFVFPKSANFKTYGKTTFKNRCTSGISRDYKLDAAKMFLETLNTFKTCLKHLVEIFISIFL